MTFALVSSSDLDRLAVVLSLPGVIGGGIFRRQTPDDQPYASALGGRFVALLPLDDTCPSSLRADMAAATPGAAIASFARVSEYRSKEGRSDVSRANSVLLVLVNNTDTSHDASFNRWYDETHLADVVNAGGFWIGVRYRSDDIPNRYLAVYESELTDSAAARAGIIQAVPKMDLWPHLEQVHLAGYGRVAP